VVYKATGSEKSDRPVFSGKVNQLRQAAFPEPQNPIHFVGGERKRVQLISGNFSAEHVLPGPVFKECALQAI